MEPEDDERPFVIVALRDTLECRFFVELSSYASDLTEARDALDLAIRGADGNSALAEASRHLVGLAAVAYCRAFVPSTVRGRLTDFVCVPDDLAEVHDRMRAYRNATVAHSQSELAVTYAVGVLDSDTLRVRDVAGPTILVPIPISVVHELRVLIDVMMSRLDEAIEPVRRGLIAELAAMDRSQVESATRPDVEEKWAHQFNPRTKRARYPAGHTIYWDAAPGASEQ